MANMSLNYENPNWCISYLEPTRGYFLERDPIFLFIVEIVDYSLRHHNLPDWKPPVNLDVAHSLNAITLFDEDFMSNIISPGTEEKAMQWAYGFGFNEQIWLEFTDYGAAIHYLKNFLLNLYYYDAPLLYQVFAFACYASRIAYQRNRHGLIKIVVWALLAVFREVLSPEEYYQYSGYQISFVDNMHNNQHDQPLDVDEGIGDEDYYSSDNELSSPLFYADPILLFVEELIDYSLRYNNLHSWVPPIDIEILQRTEISYFTENIGRAIAHVKDVAVIEAKQRGFNENKWLNLQIPLEARNFQSYFFRQVMDLDDGLFLVFSFACHSSEIAVRNERNSLVNEVVPALVYFLRQYHPHQQHYKEFDTGAIECFNARRNSESSDDGIHSVDQEDVPSHSDAEQNEAYREETPPHSDREQNEAEERGFITL